MHQAGRRRQAAEVQYGDPYGYLYRQGCHKLRSDWVVLMQKSGLKGRIASEEEHRECEEKWQVENSNASTATFLLVASSTTSMQSQT